MSDLNYDKEHCCCFFGHRKIAETKELRDKLYTVVIYIYYTKRKECLMTSTKENASVPTDNVIQ